MVRLTDYTEVLPDYPDGVYAVTRPWGESHRALVERFIRAWRAGARWAHDNPQPAVELVMAATGLDRAGAEQQVIGLAPEGALNLPGLRNVLDLRTQFGYALPMGTELSRYYDASYFRNAVPR